MNNNRIRKVLITALILFLVICTVILISGLRHSDNQKVFIIQDGVILYQLDLKNEDDRLIRIDGENGKYNIIEIKDHTIRMKEADCPDKVCIHTGVLRSENLPVVCLPNKLIIRFGEEEK